jgi:hypothetical protein
MIRLAMGRPGARLSAKFLVIFLVYIIEIVQCDKIEKGVYHAVSYEDPKIMLEFMILAGLMLAFPSGVQDHETASFDFNFVNGFSENHQDLLEKQPRTSKSAIKGFFGMFSKKKSDNTQDLRGIKAEMQEQFTKSTYFKLYLSNPPEGGILYAPMLSRLPPFIIINLFSSLMLNRSILMVSSSFTDMHMILGAMANLFIPFPVLHGYKILNIEDPYSNAEFENLNTADPNQRFIIMADVPSSCNKIPKKKCWNEKAEIRDLISKKVQYMIMIDHGREVKLRELPVLPPDYVRPMTKLLFQLKSKLVVGKSEFGKNGVDDLENLFATL